MDFVKENETMKLSFINLEEVFRDFHISFHSNTILSERNLRNWVGNLVKNDKTVVLITPSN